MLLITSDQQHWRTLGIFNREIHTPNLDRLAENGVVFTRAYCPNPTCTPTRASMITGVQPSTHGAWSLGTKLPETVPVLGDFLHRAGVASSLVGKAHFQPLASTDEYPSLEAYPKLQDLAFWKDFHGPFYGFDHVELARNHVYEAHVGQHYALWMEEKGLADWRRYFLEPTGTMKRPKSPAEHDYRWRIPDGYHYNDWITERTNALLSDYAERNERFVHWASFFDPHPPYLVPEPWCSMYNPDELTLPSGRPGEHDADPPHLRLTQEQSPDFSGYQETPFANHGFQSHLVDEKRALKNMAVYYGMVSMLDDRIGQIMDHLEEVGLAEDTLVVFTTDHGHYFGQHGLHAKGAFHYDDGIRVPFIASHPSMPTDIHTGSLLSLTDVAPTILDALALEVPYHMTGKSQWPTFVSPDTSRRRHVVCENHHQPTKLYAKTLVTETHKLTVYLNESYGELYDLNEDPNEYDNRWADPRYEAVKNELLLQLIHAQMADESLPMPRIAVA